MEQELKEEFEEFTLLINPDEFIMDMFRCGEIQKVDKDYANNCRLLCNNSVAWVLNKIHHTSFFYQIKVVVGKFNNWEHTWIKAGDYYIDLTLAQFQGEEKLSISKIGEIEGYQVSEILEPIKWIKGQVV